MGPTQMSDALRMFSKLNRPSHQTQHWNGTFCSRTAWIGLHLRVFQVFFSLFRLFLKANERKKRQKIMTNEIKSLLFAYIMANGTMCVRCVNEMRCAPCKILYLKCNWMSNVHVATRWTLKNDWCCEWSTQSIHLFCFRFGFTRILTSGRRACVTNTMTSNCLWTVPLVSTFSIHTLSSSLVY